MNFEQFETIPIYRSIINYSRKIRKSDCNYCYINPKNFPPIPLTPLNLKYLNRYNFPHYYNCRRFWFYNIHNVTQLESSQFRLSFLLFPAQSLIWEASRGTRGRKSCDRGIRAEDWRISHFTRALSLGSLIFFEHRPSGCDSAIYDSSVRRRGFPRTGSATLYRPLHRNLSITIASVAVDQR